MAQVTIRLGLVSPERKYGYLLVTCDKKKADGLQGWFQKSGNVLFDHDLPKWIDVSQTTWTSAIAFQEPEDMFNLVFLEHVFIVEST